MIHNSVPSDVAELKKKEFERITLRPSRDYDKKRYDTGATYLEAALFPPMVVLSFRRRHGVGAHRLQARASLGGFAELIGCASLMRSSDCWTSMIWASRMRSTSLLSNSRNGV